MRITLDEAASLIQNGQVVAVPTETVYGLAASLNCLTAIRKVFEIKGRPLNNPLIVHIASLEDLAPFHPSFPLHFEDLAEHFWPGPLTIVLPIDPNKVPAEVRAGLSTVAVRMPENETALKLLRKTGPLVMPSANLSGRPSSTLAEHVEADFGESFPVLESGLKKRGLESTILYYHEGAWKIIRQGALPKEAFTLILGYEPTIMGYESNEAPKCPGQLYRHYAPHAKLHLTKTFEEGMSGTILGFHGRKYPSKCHVISLGSLNNPEEIGEKLYGCLRELDERGIASAFVDIDFPLKGLFRTIYERLQKASSPFH